MLGGGTAAAGDSTRDRGGLPSAERGARICAGFSLNFGLRVSRDIYSAKQINGGMEDRPTFLLTENGRPFTRAGFGNWFHDRCLEVGSFRGRAHGLRKTAAVFLAECGATHHEIMSVTGHQTLKEVENYTEGARKAGLANQAFATMGIAQVSHSPADEVAHFINILVDMALRADWRSLGEEKPP